MENKCIPYTCEGRPLEEFLSYFNEGDYCLVTYHWSRSKETQKMNKLCKQGLFKRSTQRGVYKYTKT